MTKSTPLFFCSHCGQESSRWMGRCSGCGKWNSLREAPSSPSSQEVAVLSPTPLNSLTSPPLPRFDAGLKEINRVLGGGITRGSAILVGGGPGIGKSTLMMQMASSLVSSHKVLYLSGEESFSQIRERASRLGLSSTELPVLCTSSLEALLTLLETTPPAILIVDSIQTLRSSAMGGAPLGSVNQMRHACHHLISWGKENDAAVFFIGHLTKEGLIAGPKILEHMVDSVLYFDQSDSEIRILRAMKNRFGSVDEVALFTMGERGLTEVTDPSDLFLIAREGAFPPGSSIALVHEGTRVLTVEIQSLVVPTRGGAARIHSDRIDPRRVSRLTAVLEKYGGISFSDQEIYVNVAGGLTLSEVGMELPLALALFSARTGCALSPNLASTGEVTLSGEIRAVPYLRARLKSACDMGFVKILAPPLREPKAAPPSVVATKTIGEALPESTGK